MIFQYDTNILSSTGQSLSADGIGIISLIDNHYGIAFTKKSLLSSSFNTTVESSQFQINNSYIGEILALIRRDGTHLTFQCLSGETQTTFVPAEISTPDIRRRRSLGYNAGSMYWNDAVAPVFGAALRFSGTDNSSIEQGFRFEASVDQETWKVMGTAPAISSGKGFDKTIHGFDYNTQYYTRIIAWNEVGDSQSSIIAIATKPQQSPTDLNATTLNDTQVSVTFKEPTEKPLGGYQIDYSLDGNSWTSDPNIISVGNTNYTVKELTGGLNYKFRIRSVNINETGFSGADWSNIATASTNVTIYTYWDIEEQLGNIVQGYRLNDVSSTNSPDIAGIRPGTYQNTYTQGVSGIPGSTQSATTFGGNSHVTTSNGGTAMGVLSPDTPFTMTIWVKTTSTATTRRIFSMGATSTNRGPQITAGATDGSRAKFILYDNLGNLLVNSETSANIADNNWHLLACVWTGTHFIGYCDGVAVSTTPISSASFGLISTDRIRICASATGSIGLTWWTGTAANAVVRDKALTTSQLLTLYTKGITTS